MQSFLLQDCDCVLLKKYSPHIQSTLRHEFHKNNESQSFKTSPELQDLLEAKDQISVVTSSSVFASVVLHAHIIICISTTGKIPIKLSQSRPNCPILTIVKSRKLARVLTIYKNVLPTVFVDKLCDYSYMDQIKLQLQHGIEVAKQLKLISVGDLIIYCFDSFEKTDEEVTTYQTSYLSEDIIRN